jgi:hypothetical protein
MGKSVTWCSVGHTQFMPIIIPFCLPRVYFASLCSYRAHLISFSTICAFDWPHSHRTTIIDSKAERFKLSPLLRRWECHFFLVSVQLLHFLPPLTWVKHNIRTLNESQETLWTENNSKRVFLILVVWLCTRFNWVKYSIFNSIPPNTAPKMLTVIITGK